MCTPLREAEYSRLDKASLPVTPERIFGLIALLESWLDHVINIEAEINLNESASGVWGINDLVAALEIRSFIARGVAIVDVNSIDGFMQALGGIDLRFKHFTENDESGVVRGVGEIERSIGEWWWDRIPRTGPIRREIELRKLGP